VKSNWYHWLSENVTRCDTRTSVFVGTTLGGGGGTPNIFSSVLRKSCEWPRRMVVGSIPPKPSRGLATGQIGSEVRVSASFSGACEQSH